jgi:hypothetical protein
VEPHLVEVVVEFAQEQGASLGVEPEAAFLLIEQLRLDSPGGEQVDDDALGVDPEQFDQVEDQGELVVIVGVDQADGGVEAGEEAGPLDEAVEDAICIIEKAIELGVTR